METEKATAYFNQKLYEALQGRINGKYDEQTAKRVVHAVHNCLVDALGAERDKVLPDSFLVSELQAESIDGLDIAFTLERILGIKFSKESGRPLAMLYKNPNDAEPREKTVLELAEEAYQLAMD